MTRSEEHAFWKTHDATDYLGETTAVAVTRSDSARSKCAQCGKVLRSRFVDVTVANRRVQLRRLRQLYCPDQHETRLAPEAQRLVDAVEAVVRLAQASEVDAEEPAFA